MIIMMESDVLSMHKARSADLIAAADRHRLATADRRDQATAGRHDLATASRHELAVADPHHLAAAHPDSVATGNGRRQAATRDGARVSRWRIRLPRWFTVDITLRIRVTAPPGVATRKAS